MSTLASRCQRAAARNLFNSSRNRIPGLLRTESTVAAKDPASKFIFLTALPKSTSKKQGVTTKDIRKLLEPFGSLAHVHLGYNRRYAEVEFAQFSAAERFRAFAKAPTEAVILDDSVLTFAFAPTEGKPGVRAEEAAGLVELVPETASLNVRRIPSSATKADIEAAFTKFGPIRRVWITSLPADLSTQQEVTVLFQNKESAVAAYEASRQAEKNQDAKGIVVGDRTLRVNYEKEPTTDLYFHSFNGDIWSIKPTVREALASLNGIKFEVDPFRDARRRGAGYIGFTSVEDAMNARELLDGLVVPGGRDPLGARLWVSFAARRTTTSRP